jgi:predicted house-cleaning noncanonical NTP pyrophosphatase (MazG superfamily)
MGKNTDDKSQKYVELARKIVDEKTRLDERAELEDQLVEMAYMIANKFEITAEELETIRDSKRDKNGGLKIEGEPKVWLRKKLEEEIKTFFNASEREKVIEGLGDVLEVVENYTARF